MTVEPEDDRLHVPEPDDASFRDAVTFAFGDPAAKLYGLARVSHGIDGSGGLAVLYAGDKPVAASAGGAGAGAGLGARAAGASAVGADAGRGTGAAGAGADPPTWDSVRAAGVHATVVEPLEAWTVTYADQGGAMDLRFEACSAPAAIDADAAVARTGGMQGYDQICRVTGTASHGGRTHQVRCLGQRGQLWGNPDWGRIELSRTVSAWLDDDRAVTLTAVRPAKSKGHLDEALGGFLFEGGEPVEIAEPRLSTTYDGELHQRRAGLELWMSDEDERGHRMAGEVLCGTSIDLGEQRLDSAFFQWRMEGRTGVGRYDVLRRTEVPGRKRR
jgi:hypothetical protein